MHLNQLDDSFKYYKVYRFYYKIQNMFYINCWLELSHEMCWLVWLDYLLSMYCSIYIMWSLEVNYYWHCWEHSMNKCTSLIRTMVLILSPWLYQFQHSNINLDWSLLRLSSLSKAWHRLCWCTWKRCVHL